MENFHCIIIWGLIIVGALAACGDDKPESQWPATDMPRPQAQNQSVDHRFSGKVPKLAKDEPRDTLVMQRTFGDSSTFGLVSTVRAIGDYVVVGDRFVSPHLAIYRRSTGELHTRLGRDGQGPGEFKDPAGTFVVSEDPAQVWVYDFQNRRFTLIGLDASGEAMIKEELPLNVGASLENPVWINGRIVSNGLFPDYTLLVADSSGKPISRVIAGPPVIKDVAHVPGARQANRNFLAVDPNGQRFALAYQFASRIDFFDAEGGRYGSVNGPRETSARYHIDQNGRFQWEPDNEAAYWIADATENYVYALFCGCEIVEGNELPTRLHIFKWNGDFVGELAFDRPLSAFSVSRDDTVIYGAYEDPYPGLGEWRLPSWLHSRGLTDSPVAGTLPYKR